jgi:hypothetical protein
MYRSDATKYPVNGDTTVVRSAALGLAQPEAELPANDIYELWEPMVRSDSSKAFADAKIIQDKAVQRVRSIAASSHTGVITPFQFWYHTGSGVWLWSTVYTEN